MSEIVLTVLAIGLFGMALILYTRHGWRVEGVLSALFGVFLIGALIFNIVYFISDPRSNGPFFIVLPFVLPAFLLVVMLVETSSPDPFTPAPPRIREAFAELIENYETAGWSFTTATMRRRSFGIAQLVLVHLSDEIIAVIAGNNPARSHVWLFSQISGHLAVLSTVNHGSGSRPPGELRQWLPGADFLDLFEAHKEGATISDLRVSQLA